MPENATLLQGFEWNVPADGKHWQRLLKALPSLKNAGIDNLWLPPGCKASSPEGNGYDIYDLYDLGEFDQKNSVRTKWGTKDELLELSNKAKELGIGLYWDAVLNHKAGADKREKAHAVEVDNDDRTKEVTDPYQISAWLGFDFPGRGDKYSKQKYHWYHFSGTDYDAKNERNAIFKLKGEGKSWSESVDDEGGNADYMMFADVDYSHPETQEDVKNWGEWIVNEVGLKGFRLDAVQHFSERFANDWVQHVRSKCGDAIFMVGEFWTGDTENMLKWLDAMDRKFSLFDAPLLYNFNRLSTTPDADLRTVFDNSLTKRDPVNSVTVVMNHDTQPGQTMDTKIEGFFKPLAYALILLQDAGYPCLFYGDLYGMKGDSPEPPAASGKIPDMALARKLYAYGRQDEYLDDPNCIGFTRLGTAEHPAGLACVMSNKGPGSLRMFVGEMHRGEVWTDVLGWEQGEVTIGEDGLGDFRCPGVSVAIWVKRDAEGRDRFPVEFDNDIYNEA
ncbi:glycoside hydrolase family 13 protein [Pseudocercospora fijiensis CIRAD86]|uniref:Glycoside hydrolase family 13 protein n=1 Tax=Pseudocercospora fijiensis (strain CIRAD86) TaxID=383855 RepID=M3AJC5_PSEFD|nr:glycoside hydrolase family 13 protein [Pseudocercospora fijiensis CIRAD86]EME77258.1 glycoside hydrolase family 13 protein [Pseudocercospora fijiensis CIRAD86]